MATDRGPDVAPSDEDLLLEHAAWLEGVKHRVPELDGVASLIGATLRRFVEARRAPRAPDEGAAALHQEWCRPCGEEGIKQCFEGAQLQSDAQAADAALRPARSDA